MCGTTACCAEEKSCKGVISCKSAMDEIVECLQGLGFDATQNEGVGIVKVGDTSDPFITILNLDDEQMHVTCQIGVQGDFEEEKLPLIFYNALCQNSRIRPFAFEIIDTRDDPTLKDPKDFPIVLGDSLPLGDLSEQELEKTMQKLLQAISSCNEVLNV